MATPPRHTRPRRSPAQGARLGPAGERLAPPATKKKRRRKRRSARARSRAGARNGWSLAASYGAFAGLWVGLLLAVSLAWWGSGLPSTDGLRSAALARTVVMLDVSGRQIARRGEREAFVPLGDIAPALRKAVLATEDRRFYDHFGLDLFAVVRAAFANAEAGRVVQGGSTITQQLAKNLFLGRERTFERKMQEALLALWLEIKFEKDEILELYLNRVYFGAGAFGVEAAARRYFNKAASQLSLPEAAMLAGLLKAPSRYAPTAAPALAQERRAEVLSNMVEAGWLARADARTAAAQPLRFAPAAATPGAQYFADWVLDQLPAFVGERDRDLFVETTLDLRLQRAAEAAVRTALDREGAKLKAAEGALVAMAPSGAVRALVGGRSYAQSQFDRAVQARRQPGSAFKPFVYLAALQKGWTADDVVSDSPVRIGRWTPGNYEGRYDGEITLTEALARSSNAAAVRLTLDAGPRAVQALARRLGLDVDGKADASLALGAYEVSLLELTGAYAPFANGGQGVFPHAIVRVRTKDGATLYARDGAGRGAVAEPPHIGAMNRMLAQVLVDGTGKAARLEDRVAAGKTGTSQGFRDAWFVGYTADLVAGVWTGNDDGRPMAKVTGGALPARIWHAFMTEALRGRPALPLPGLDAMPEPGGALAPDEEATGLFDRILDGVLGERPATD